MAQPTPYNRQASFTTIQQAAPTDPLPGDTLDAELNAVKQTADEILANLALIQRDDGAVANRAIGLDQLKSEVEIGFNAPTVWATGTVYDAFDAVFINQRFYRCLVAHTAGVFATDLAALKWEEIADFTQIGGFFAGSSTTQQTIGTGTKSFTIESDRFFEVDDYLVIAADASNYMLGRVTAYAGTNLTVEIEDSGGSGTFNAWTLHISGRRGPQGVQGLSGTMSIGTVTTGAAGTGAFVTNSGTPEAAVLDFTIPKGDPGDVASVAGKIGDVVLVAADISDASAAGQALMTAADAAAQRTALGLGVFATGTDAANLTGTLADVRLSSNVPLKDAANSFTAAPSTSFSPAGFGGTFLTANEIRSVGTVSHTTDGRTTLSVYRDAAGSGANGQAAADSAAYIHALQTNYLTSTVLGEVDGLNVNLRKGVNGDGAAILVNAKKVDSASYGLTAVESRVAMVQATTGTELRAMKVVSGRFAGNIDTSFAGIGFYTRPDAASSVMLAAFAMNQDLTNSSYFDRILLAAYQSDPTTRFFEIATGSDHKTATTIYGPVSSSIAVRYLLASTAMQWLATDGSTALMSLANTTGALTTLGKVNTPGVTVAPPVTAAIVTGVDVTLSEAATAGAGTKLIFNNWVINDGSTAAATTDFIKGAQINMLVDTVSAVNPGAGGRIGLNVVVQLNHARNSGLNDFVGGYFHGWAFVSDGGGVGTERGTVFGGAGEGILQGTATNFQAVHAWEQNVGIFSGCSAKYKTIVNYSNLGATGAVDAVKGSVIDAMGWYYSQALASVGFDYGLLFGDPTASTGVLWPITSTGTLIGAGAGTVAKGIDLSNLTITSAAFKSSGFSVDGSGNVVAKSLLANSTAGFIGYATAAWGSVTQATSKSTAVTINTPSGTITMNNTSLANAANVSFTVNNSTVEAADTVVVNIETGATGQAYQVFAELVAAGSFKIWVRNISGGALAEAVAINFVVIKGKH